MMISSRRAFLGSIAGGWLASTLSPSAAEADGHTRGASSGIGHLLRDGALDDAVPEGETERVDVAIVGAGASGLSAAWRLAPAGLSVRVLELEPFIGGTSTWGEEGVVPHPWGAHYLAAPNLEARSVIRLLQQMGALQGFDAAGRPLFDPKLLCHSPQERLYYQGKWHDGLVPDDALPAAARAELARFTRRTEELTRRVGRDGRPTFTIPVHLSSRDAEMLELDRISMGEWLRREGFVEPFLHWYVRYATLDDFGGEPDDVSAWAGLHYFAARKLDTPQLEGSHFMVWPEGNGRLIRALLEGGHSEVQPGALVLRVDEGPRGSVSVRYYDVGTQSVRQLEARGVVLATPGFVATRMLAPPLASRVTKRIASPWMVANLHVTWPIDPAQAWDSVIYDSKGLGYVDARHMLTAESERTVLTYFRAYGDADTAATRRMLVNQSWSRLVEGVMHDLSPAHPHLAEQTERVDVMVWGHAMPRPQPGFLGERPFDASPLVGDRVAWGHVDQSGMALFEEAISRGVLAAESLAEKIGVELGETWS